MLRIAKTAPRRVQAGRPFVYVIRVRNRSNVIARNVTLRDPLPRGLVLIASRPRAQVRGRMLNMRLGNMRPGQMRTIRVAVRSTPRTCGLRTNVAVANAANATRVIGRARTALICARPAAIAPAVTG